MVWAFPGLIWSVWALSEWCGTAADPFSPVVALGFVICRWGRVNMRVNWDRVRAKKFPSIRRVLESGV